MLINTKNKKSVQTKVFLALFVIFMLIMATSIRYTYLSQHELAYKIMQGQAKMTAQFYVDNMNMMMINDEMEDRGIIQDKMLEQPGIIDARIVRSPLINKEYGDGFPDQVPRDEYDERALQGEEITWISEDENGRKLNITYPIPALKVWRGVKCLDCH